MVEVQGDRTDKNNEKKLGGETVPEPLLANALRAVFSKVVEHADLQLFPV